MPTSPADLSRLEALAREATPQWEDDLMENILCDCLSNMNEYARARAYIAAANPAAVLALIERVRELEAVADINLVSWTKQSVRAWGHDLTRESLTELLAAAEECAGDLASRIESDFCSDSHSSTDQFVYEMRRVNRLRAAVARVRGE